jgi:hypothetical protein
MEESMKDLTVGQFCKKFGACQSGRKWAYNLTEKRSKAMMSEIWEYLEFENYLEWVIDRALNEKERIAFACRCVRETTLHDGRKVWGLLTDERSRNAIIVAEKYLSGNATKEELKAANIAATAAANAANAYAYVSAIAATAAANAANAYVSAIAAADSAYVSAIAANAYVSVSAANAAAIAAANAARKQQKTFLANPFRIES